ncbi:MAG TPA: hypothetical protein VLL08_18310 [Kineosporiaceae bacterium]|nr:hypothetical protein [Kineosporiaceae bacterium]
MKLQSKKARVPIAALGVTALIAGAGALTSPAFAVTALTLNSGGTTPAVANLGTATTAAANAAYALKVTGADEAVTLGLVTAPTGGSLALQKVAANGDAVASGFSVVADLTSANEVQTVTLSAGTSDGGGMVLKLGSVSTASISGASGRPTAAAVQTALNAVVGDGNDVTVTGTTPYSVAFGGSLGGTNLPLMTAAASDISVSAVAQTVTPANSVQGAGKLAYLGTPTSAHYIYVTGDVPGTYTFRMFQDTNTNSVFDSDDERATALITMTVYDAGGTGTTTSTTDDVAPVITANTPVTVGRAISAGITYSKSLSLTDSRGTSVSTGIAARLAALTFIDRASEDADAAVDVIDALGADVLNQVSSYSTTTHETTYAVGTPDEAGTITLRGDLKISSVATDNLSYGTKTVEVASNTVNLLALDAPDVVGTVETTGTAVTVKSGTAAVTYEATATNTTPAPDVLVSGALVYFTLAGDNVDDLTTNGTAVPGEDNVFSATTDADGVATLIVTSSATADTDSYTVDADTNGSGASAMTAIYEDAEADSVEVTNTAAELTPTAAAGVSVTLKGKLLDQFAAAYTPAASAPQAVVVTVPAGGTTICQAVVTAGAFSCAYAPATAPTAGTTATFRFAYSGGAAPSVDDTIRWASTTAAATVTLTTPTADATGVTIQDKTTPVATQGNAGTVPFGNTTGAVTGTVYDSTNTALAYKTVTLTGGSGVYFSTVGTPTSDASDDLTTSLTVVTNSSGQFSAFAFFTKSGVVKVTATSGTVMDEASVTTLDSTDPYFVTVNDVTGAPGSTLIVTGTVKDAFLNPVPNGSADLSIGTSTLGAFGDTTPQANANGVFSTTFTSGSNSSGTADLMATLSSQVANPTASDDWVDNAGVTVAHGEYMDTATITLVTTKLTLSSTAKLMGGGTAHITGAFTPNTGVDLYSKPSGAAVYSLIDSVETDEAGAYAASYFLKKTTSFLAKSAGLSSAVDTTVVYSTVKLTGKSYSHNRATLMANGSPSAKGTLTFYRSVVGKDPVLGKMTSNSFGNGTKTVTLPKGTRSVYAKFKAPGTVTGKSKIIKITVK